MHNDFLDKDLGVETLNLHGKLLFEPSENLNIVLGGNYADRDDFAAIGLEAIDGNTAGRSAEIRFMPQIAKRQTTPQNFQACVPLCSTSCATTSHGGAGGRGEAFR